MNTKNLLKLMRLPAVAPRPRWLPIAGALCLGLTLLQGCQKAPPAGDAKAAADKTATDKTAGDAKVAGEAKTAGTAHPQADAKPDSGDKKDAADGVTLTVEQAAKMGLVAEAVKKIVFAEEIAGFGAVVAHEAVAQGAAELATAQATEQQSAATLARSRRLSGTAGAMSADIVETNVRQAAVDRAALELAKQRLSATFGQQPPWAAGERGQILQGLANGTIKLVRVTFPLGALTGAAPKTLRVARLGSAQGDRGWKINVVWSAPADATVPGRSFFALLRGSDVGEGERLMVWAPAGPSVVGVLLPASAAVISDGKYWVYVETKPGSYVRTEIDTSRPSDDGFFVTKGVTAGNKVVTKEAGQLLARESSNGSDAE